MYFFFFPYALSSRDTPKYIGSLNLFSEHCYLSGLQTEQPKVFPEEYGANYNNPDILVLLPPHLIASWHSFVYPVLGQFWSHL